MDPRYIVDILTKAKRIRALDDAYHEVEQFESTAMVVSGFSMFFYTSLFSVFKSAGRLTSFARASSSGVLNRFPINSEESCNFEKSAMQESSVKCISIYFGATVLHIVYLVIHRPIYTPPCVEFQQSAGRICSII